MENKTTSALSLDHWGWQEGSSEWRGESQYDYERKHRKLRLKSNVHVGIETKRSREPPIANFNCNAMNKKKIVCTVT